MKNKETADAVLKAMREICRQRGLCCATTVEIVAHTGLRKRVVVAAIAALRRKRASNADKVFETTYADADAGPTAIAHGWTLEELWRDGGA